MNSLNGKIEQNDTYTLKQIKQIYRKWILKQWQGHREDF